MKYNFKKQYAGNYRSEILTNKGIYTIEIFSNYDKKFGYSIYLNDTLLDGDYGFNKKSCILSSTSIVNELINKVN